MLQKLGTTHKAEWDRFSRQCLDRRKFPQSLAAVFMKDKTDLFRTWLQQEEDWSKFLVASLVHVYPVSFNALCTGSFVSYFGVTHSSWGVVLHSLPTKDRGRDPKKGRKNGAESKTTCRHKSSRHPEGLPPLKGRRLNQEVAYCWTMVLGP